jgi:hypothetical protein
LIRVGAAGSRKHMVSDMERAELLRARIGLYRRYLREGADGDLARAYLWLIRQDEIELTGIVGSEGSGTATAAAKRQTRSSKDRG